MTSSYFKRVFLFFQICQLMYHEFDVDQNFLGTAVYCFLMEVTFFSFINLIHRVVKTKNGPGYKFAFLKVSYAYFLCLQRFKHFCLHPRLTVPCMLLKLFCAWESCLPCLFVRTWEIEKVFCQIRFSTVLKWYCKAESIATQCGGQVYRRSSICHHQ